MTDIDYSAVSDVVRQEAEKRKALHVLLDELHTKDKHHLAIQVQMGRVASYVTSVTLRWIAAKVGFAADLPIFTESTAGSKRIAVDPDTIEIIQQRQPNWKRQQGMTEYLATRQHHKFPPLLLVAYQHWVYDVESDKWGPDQSAMCDSLTVTSLEPSGTYWDLDDGDTLFYALDGQHRLMAILGLRDLVTTGSLHALDENRKPQNKPPLSRDELIKRSGGDKNAIHERLQHVMDERIGIEIMPAVISGETFVHALRRLRQLFVDVNQNAKPLTKSELAQLDENDGFRIVARKLMGRHALLRNSVDTTKQTLSDKSPFYTTLHHLSTIVERYLVESGTPPQVALWRLQNRPDEESLKIGTSAMSEYFDALARLPLHEAFIQGKPAGDIKKIDANILFRPVAQMALAEAIGKLSHEGISLRTIVDTLTEQENLGQLKLTDQSTPWFGVLCDPVSHKMRRHRRNEALCCRLFQYLLGRGIPDDVDREQLRVDFAHERRVDDNQAIDLKGKTVKLDDVRLPTPWR